MAFFIKQDENWYLKDTGIENIFINEYMTQAPGDYVKIYILALMYAKMGADISNEAIAKSVGVEEEDVLKARKTCLYDEEVMSAQGLRKLKTYKTPIFDEDSQDIIGTVGIARDITREKEYRSTIQRLTREDQLTSLLNREYFYDILKKNNSQAYTLLSFDIEGFHGFNERYGHPLGDAVLQIVAEELRSAFTTNHAARLGGDEFAVFLPDDLSDETAEASVKAFQEQLSFMLSMDDRMKHLRVNAGIVHALPGMTPASLMPLEARAVGIDYDTLCDTIARLALLS